MYLKRIIKLREAPPCSGELNTPVILIYIFPKRILTMHAGDGIP
jgi:hypothetical protein